MPIDARIALSGRMPQINSPVKTMGDIMALRSAQQHIQGQQLDNQKRMRESADDAAIRVAISAHPNDIDAAVEELKRGGHGTAALALQQHMHQARSAQFASKLSETRMMKAAMEMQEHFLAGVHDEATFQIAKGLATQLFPAQPGQPSPADMMGEHYDEKSFKQLLESMQSPRDRILQHHYGAMEASEALRRQALEARQGAASAKDKAATTALWRSYAGRVLGTAHGNDEWQQRLKQLKGAGVPADVLDSFGSVYSARAVQEAKDAQLTENQRRTLLIREREAAVREKDANTRAANAGADNPKKTDPWYERDMSAYKSFQTTWNREHAAGQQNFDPATGKLNKSQPFTKYQAPPDFAEWRKEHGHPPKGEAGPASGGASGGEFKMPNGQVVKPGQPITLKDGTPAIFMGVNPKTGKPIINPMPATPKAAVPPSGTPQPQPDDEADNGDDEAAAASADDDEAAAMADEADQADTADEMDDEEQPPPDETDEEE